MQLKKIKKSIKSLFLAFNLTLIAGCAAQTGIPDACATLEDIVPDAGYKSRLTANEQRAIEKNDCDIDRMCHRPNQCPE